MNTTSKQTQHPLSKVKTVLFTVACIAIFIAVAVICGAFTAWMPNNTARIAIREVLLRTPLTIFALHFFARKVIKTYNPLVIYGKLVFIKIIKWTAIALILPLSVGVFYYLFHFMVPFAQSIPLTNVDKLGLLIKWLAISIAAGITEEVLFRGHLYMIISSRCSKLQSIFLTSLIFGIVHIAMLPVITPLDIVIVVIGGIIAGTMFSLICQYTKSVWYAAIVHVVWDIFFIGKITAVAATQAVANGTIFPFKMATHNLLIAGGNFGIEATL
ncbi:MAG: CPBP family intramembrane glutamic endopeptidase, partial [Mucilaginibacter sp.]